MINLAIWKTRTGHITIRDAANGTTKLILGIIMLPFLALLLIGMHGIAITDWLNTLLKIRKPTNNRSDT